MLGDAFEVGEEVAALRGGKRRQQLALRFGNRGLGAAKAAGAGRRQLDELAPAVASIAAANDQPVHLELIQERNQVRWMKAERPAELTAVSRASLLEAVEDGELVAAHADGVKRAAQALARHPRHAGEQQPAASSGGGAFSLPSYIGRAH